MKSHEEEGRSKGQRDLRGVQSVHTGLVGVSIRDVLINSFKWSSTGGGGGEFQDLPTQNLGKPRDPEMSHPQRGGGGWTANHPPTQPPKQYTRHENWTRFQKFLKQMSSLFIVVTA